MGAISDFVNTIVSYEITIPLTVQIIIIIILIIVLCVGGYFMRESFQIESMRSGMSWFIFVAVLNLISLLLIFLYYNTKHGNYKGNPGKKGKKGSTGKKGTSVSCSLCKSNLYIQTAKQSDTLCKLNKYTPAFTSIFANKKYFDTILNKGNSINYDSFIDTIILNNKPDSSNQEAINIFKSLMNTNSIAVLLIQAVNEITKSSLLSYGSIRRPNALEKYVALGDSVYGGTEDAITLNSFIIAGNILYPQRYDRLVQFNAFNAATGADEQYVLWRPIGQTTNERDSKGNLVPVKFHSLGDICRNVSNSPNINETPTISEKCLERVNLKDIQLVFIYVGNIQVNSDSISTQSDSYLIENAPLNDIEVFSLWRTPLNTFITNCNSTNTLVNNSVIYNIYNINADTDKDKPTDEDDDVTGGGEEDETKDDILTSSNTISANAKNKFTELLSSIYVPSIVTALILAKYYEIELKKDLLYYINSYKSSVPEFANVNTNALSLGDLMKLISTVKEQYEKYNNDVSDDPKNDKNLPTMILKIYNNANTKLLSISVQIANTNTFLDIINLVFESGINTRIAIDSQGIAQGGIFMNSIQELILRICKMLVPPNVPVYNIKDECLGTFSLDRKRANIIKEFVDSYNIYKKLLIEIAKICEAKIDNGETSVCNDLLANVKNYTTNIIDFKFGQLCGHIDNYAIKIYNGKLDEFTTNRIKGLIEIINDSHIYLKELIESAQ
jgi:hypothetical protein